MYKCKMFIDLQAPTPEAADLFWCKLKQIAEKTKSVACVKAKFPKVNKTIKEEVHYVSIGTN